MRWGCRSDTGSGRRATTMPRRLCRAHHRGGGKGLKPFAPVQLGCGGTRARATCEIGWIRRTRFGGDGWELAEVPLNEEREAYRLEIYDGLTWPGAST